MSDILVSGAVQNVITHQDKYKIELAKGQKGSYGWTITTYAGTVAEAIAQLKSADQELAMAFSSSNGNGNSTTE